MIEHFIRYEHEETIKDLLNNRGIIRIGTPKLQDKRIQDLTFEAICDCLNQKLYQERRELSKLIDCLNQEVEAYSKYMEDLLDCEKLSKGIGRSARASRVTAPFSTASTEKQGCRTRWSTSSSSCPDGASPSCTGPRRGAQGARTLD